MAADRKREPCCQEHAVAPEPDPQHEHREKLTCHLWAMKKRGDFCDVNVRVQGRAVKCHKVVLVASSDYFSSMFNMSHQFRENREGISEVSLEADIYTGITPEVVESVLFYIYNGALPEVFSMQTVPDIYRLADLWQLEILTKLCSKIMVANVDENSFLELLQFSKVYHDKALQAALCHYAVIHLKELSIISDFSLILPEDFMAIVNDPLFVCYEVNEWTWVIKQWANGSAPRLVEAFQQVRPREYSKEDVAVMMQDKDLTENADVMKILEENQTLKDTLDPRVRYFPTSNIDLCDNVDDRGNFCAGLMVHKRETIATEIVLISLDSFKDIIPGINNCVRIESQVVHKSEIYFLLCGGCNWHSQGGCDMTASSVFIYSLVSKTWRKKMIVLKDIAGLETDIQCINCCSADMMRLHVEKDTLFFLLLKDNRCTLVKSDLKNPDSEWEFHTSIPFDTLVFEKTNVLKISSEKMWIMEESGGNGGGIRAIELSLESHNAQVFVISELGNIVGYEGHPFEGNGEFNWYMKAAVDDLENPECIYTVKGNVDNAEDEITLGKYVIGEDSHTVLEKRKTSFCKIRNIRIEHGVIHIFAEQQDFKSAYLTYRVRDSAWTETQLVDTTHFNAALYPHPNDSTHYKLGHSFPSSPGFVIPFKLMYDS